MNPHIPRSLLLNHLLLEWVERTEERRAICLRHAQVQLEHSQISREVISVENQLIASFPGHEVELEDGRTVRIGYPGCRLLDRMRVADRDLPSRLCADGCTFSKAMYQPYPRLCIHCGEPEPPRTCLN